MYLPTFLLPYRVAQVLALLKPMEPDLVRSETGSEPESQSPPPPPNVDPTLPPELLLLVFDLIYAEGTQPLPRIEFAARRRKYPLLDAMLVCRTWHDLIVASPRYWTTVNVWLYQPISPSPGKTERNPKREAERVTLERRLKRSGERPFEVNIESNSDVDLEPIFDCLRSQGHRWQALNLFPTQNWATVYRSRLTNLFSTPLPGLKSLRVGPFCSRIMTRNWGHDKRIRGTWFRVDATNLCELSCEVNLVIPYSTFSLKSLTLTFVNTERLEPRVGNLRVELGGLVELRIFGCDLMSILSIFSTPTLNRLVIHGDRGSSRPPQFLPQYQHLKELQWDDSGPYQKFNMLAPLCPNITSFANYVVGLEEQERIRQGQRGLSCPILLRERSDIRVNRRQENCLWPKLEEILLSSATCAEIAELINALPSVYRVRVLHDPTTRGSPENQMKERHLMERLRGRVNVALWLEPWSGKRTLSDRG